MDEETEDRLGFERVRQIVAEERDLFRQFLGLWGKEALATCVRVTLEEGGVETLEIRLEELKARLGADYFAEPFSKLANVWWVTLEEKSPEEFPGFEDWLKATRP